MKNFHLWICFKCQLTTKKPKLSEKSNIEEIQIGTREIIPENRNVVYLIHTIPPAPWPHKTPKRYEAEGI